MGNQIRWAPRLARLLGRVSDRELAARAGVSRAAVVGERRRRGIPAFRACPPPVEWTEEMIALLGEASDPDVARELGISKESVFYKRRMLGIPAHEAAQPARVDRFWTARRVALLGTARDREIARRLGVSQAVVATQRGKRGIPPFEPRRPKVVWTAAMVRQLGKIPDCRIAKRFGIGQKTVREERVRRGIAPIKNDSWKVLRKPELRRLLRLPTGEVVKRTGLDEKTVRRLRSDLGMRQPGNPTAWNAKALRALGRVPDDVLAARLGLSTHTVRLKRNQLGINFRTSRHWTKEEEDLVRGLPEAEAALRTGRTLEAVQRRRRKLGLPAAPATDRFPAS